MRLIQQLKTQWTILRTKLVPEPEWVTVFQGRDEIEIRIKHMKLTDADIPAVIFNQRDSSYHAFGDIYLKVRSEKLEEAREILNLNHE